MIVLLIAGSLAAVGVLTHGLWRTEQAIRAQTAEARAANQIARRHRRRRDDYIAPHDDSLLDCRGNASLPGAAQ